MPDRMSSADTAFMGESPASRVDARRTPRPYGPDDEGDDRDERPDHKCAGHRRLHVEIVRVRRGLRHEPSAAERADEIAGEAPQDAESGAPQHARSLHAPPESTLQVLLGV